MTDPTPAHALAEKWLRAWGALKRERLETGDPSALPRDDITTVAARRGSPSNRPDIELIAMDVDDAIKTYRAPAKIQELLEFVYVHGFGFEEGLVSHTFADGTEAVLPPGQHPQAQTVERGSSHRVDTFELNDFPVAPAAQAFLIEWGCTSRKFLTWRLRDFRHHLIRAKNLSKLAHSIPSSKPS